MITPEEFYEVRGEPYKVLELAAAKIISKMVPDIHAACREARKTRLDVWVVANLDGTVDIHAIPPAVEVKLVDVVFALRFGRKGNRQRRKWKKATIRRELDLVLPEPDEYWIYCKRQRLKDTPNYGHRGGGLIFDLLERGKPQ